jgi:DNA-binding MarR family transcriptional regulator
VRDSVDEHIAAWSQELAGLDPVQEAIIGRIHLLARHSTQGRQLALRTGDLTGWQFKTLLMLRKLGRPYTASPSELASLLGLTRGALSIRLSSLEELGYVVRTTDAGDRRRVRVTLTPAGRKVLDAAMDAEGAVEERMLGVLSARERLTLADLLRKVVVGIEGGANRPP